MVTEPGDTPKKQKYFEPETCERTTSVHDVGGDHLAVGVLVSSCCVVLLFRLATGRYIPGFIPASL